MMETKTTFQIPQLLDGDDFTSEDLADDMEGLRLSFTRIKIPGGGHLQFEIPSGNPDVPDYAPYLEGVILYSHNSNAYWPEGSEYDDDQPPLCQSFDGKVGYGEPGGTCADCVLNQFGSDGNNKGKACKNMRMLYLLRSGEYMPIQIALPPIIVNKELARVDQRAIDALGEKDIIFMFPRIVKAKSTTRLVLKRPKTETSIRKVWLPKTLAYILRDWRQKQDKLKEIMGDEYADYNLVLALETGRPCEDRVIGNQFERLKKSANLPNVVFHSLRHSSTTYKLKLNHGDIKATQGDTGHAQASMVTEVYAHILDEERKINAQKFEVAFYANPDMRRVEQELNPPKPEPAPDLNLQSLLAQLQENPELARQLKALLHAG